ncbi:mechanosensitive ion channel family protein [Chitinophaga vietnamensis]|uniref:mechanosensitive ion channel family protein n=1 Tax=Chitinophaga vietnamensis TaxID=2593957 RepID=UPI00137547E2|nr:mechanosensitive ion channel domain-containing protein [Chitinophaga vietnamensis]
MQVIRPLLRVFLFVCLFFAATAAEAQHKKRPLPPIPPPDTLRTPDSATLSKRLSNLAKDSSNKAGIHRSDTSVAILISRIESYTLLLNQEMASLRRGFDTSAITEEMPLVDASLDLVKENIAGLNRTPNINDIYTNKIMLDQLDRKLDSWQDLLFDYYSKLVNINDTIHSLRKDTAMRSIPAEGELYGFYIGQLSTLIMKFHAVDSANRINLLKIGLLQNKVANRYIEVSNLAGDMDYRLDQFTAQMLNRDYRYIWKPHRDSINPLDFFPVVKQSLHKSTKVLGIFFSIQWPVFFIWLMLAGLFSWWIYYNMRRIKQRHAEEEAEAIMQHSQYVYRYPISSTIIFVTTLSSVLSVRYPILYTEINGALTMISLTYIFRTVFPKTLFRNWLLLMALLFLYGLNNLLIEITYVEQWGLLIGSVLSIVLGARLLKESAVTTFVQPRYTRLLFKSFILMSALSLLMVLFARVSFAKILGSSAVVSTALAINLFIFVKIVLEAMYLQVEANKNTSSFISFVDYQEVQRKMKTFLTVMGYIGWLMIITRNLYVYDDIYEAISDFLLTRHQLGNSDFTFSSVIIFMLVIWVAFILSQLISYLFGNTGQEKAPGKKNKLGSALLLVRLAVLAGGILLAFAASGIPMDKLTIVIGALGVGIGFGLQNIVNNLVSGVILAFEKPIEVGDVIEVGSRSGTVKEIGIRSSKISAPDGSEVIVPNGDLLSQQLVNWTLSNRTRRVELTIGVGYGSNVQQVKDILLGAFKGREGVMMAPEPVILLSQFADNSINFKVYFWISDLGTAGTMQSDVMAYIYDELNKAGIEMPYPQRDLHIRSVDNEVLQQWRPPAPGKDV